MVNIPEDCYTKEIFPVFSTISLELRRQDRMPKNEFV